MSLKMMEWGILRLISFHKHRNNNNNNKKNWQHLSESVVKTLEDSQRFIAIKQMFNQKGNWNSRRALGHFKLSMPHHPPQFGGGLEDGSTHCLCGSLVPGREEWTSFPRNCVCLFWPVSCKDWCKGLAFFHLTWNSFRAKKQLRESNP